MNISKQNIRADINKAAEEKNLIIYDGELNIEEMPSIKWSGDWMSFLDLAQKMQINLLYVYEEIYEPEEFILDEIENTNITCDADENENEKKWLSHRINEITEQWNKHRGELISLNCTWVINNIAHYWQYDADWMDLYHEAIDSVIEESKRVEPENRILRTEEVSKKLHEYATKMVLHPRFVDATSEEKRIFMASQLYPDLDDEVLFDYRFRYRGLSSYQEIAKRAALIYWWDIEPEERFTKNERVKSLYSQGESMSNIAAILKMSTAKVKAAINS